MKCIYFFIFIIFIRALSFAQTDTLTRQQSPPINPSDAYQKSIQRLSNLWRKTVSFGFDNYYSSKIQGSPEVGNILLVRGVYTNTRHIIRATLPVISSATPNGYRAGLGNFNIVDIIRITHDSANIHFGIGPLLSFPTRTNSLLGVGYLQVGLGALALYATDSGVLLGALVTYRNSFNQFSQQGGYLTIQPAFIAYLGYGFYVRNLGATLVFDFINNKTLIPLGLGIGKLFRMGQALGNIYIEPGYTVYNKGDKLPAQELLVGINFIWRNKKKNL